ncbi:hypothetical protein BJ170DRAFT_578437 [Xylariales sp. AK1849]|nr:hypothetical protein BJ170DRAFT_578437 [Xylariales sp. AK1849]
MAEVFGVAASALAVVELTAKTALICTQYIKHVSSAKRDVERLKEEVAKLGAVAMDVRQLLDKSPTHQLLTTEKLRIALSDSRSRLQQLQQELAPSKTKATMSRFGVRALKWPFKSKDTEKVVQDVARLEQMITLALQVDQTANGVSDRMVILNMDRKMVLAKLPMADGATFDSHADEHSPCCLHDTRTAVLQTITEWALDPNAKTVYWLNGMAGTGKSTIARTLAHSFSNSGTLGATFFFKRGEGDRGGTSKLFATIASQLVQRVPGIAGYVQATIDADPAIFSKALREQFRGLIIDPASKCPPDSGSRLVIIDALDECEREEDVKVLIKLLSSAKTLQNLRLKFLLTSRPDLPIRLGFDDVGGRYQDFILHEVAESVIERDIAAYLRHELGRVRQDFNRNVSEDRQLSADWPDQADLQTLVKMAIPLFIFAATVCRFVADRKGGNPSNKLQKVLQYRTKQVSRLTATYKPVLEQLTTGLPPDEQREMLQQFRGTVGAIVILANPLSLFALTRLLDITSEDILGVLDLLHSVLNVPSSSKQPIRLLHLSFRDFLVDSERRADPFWIDEREAHRHLAAQCLRIMHSSLKTDICGVRAPGTLLSSIAPEEVNRKLPSEVQYACRFWSYHLREAGTSVMDEDAVWGFLSADFLHWLEALSWMGRVSESIHAIKTLQSLVALDSDQRITKFSIDALRFILATRSGIQVAPLQIYSSALIFTPNASIVRSVYKSSMTVGMALGPKVSVSWVGQDVLTLEADSVLFSVAFSPDGKLLAAGDGETVRIWAADTGDLQQTLRGNSSYVRSVAFSPDGKLLPSGDGETVRIWGADTGDLQQTLRGHSDYVRSVAFSPDGKLVASASYDKTVRIWAADTGDLQQTLRGHSGPVYSVTFSPDGKLLASGDGETVRIWAADTGDLQQTLRGNFSYVRSVAFSPDGKLLASGDGETVRIWGADTGDLQQTLEGHSCPVQSVAFSPDGKLVASASYDKTVRIWAADTGDLQQTLRGHSGPVYSVTFSPDGKLLASGDGETVRIWGADTGDLQQTLDIGAVTEYPRFDDNNTQIWTNAGAFDLQIALDSLPSKSSGNQSRPSAERQPNLQNRVSYGYGISKENNWITYDGENILWLPVGCRPTWSTCLAASGSAVAIGIETGVLIICFEER